MGTIYRWFMENTFQLQQYKNVNSTNLDISDRVFLESKQKNLINYDVINSVNVAEQFETERQNTLRFKIYGGLEYCSPLNNIKLNYNTLSDIFNKQIVTGSVKNIYNSFDIYLLKPYTGYTQLTSTKFIKQFKVIATPSMVDVFDAAFSKNIFYEKKSMFVFSDGFEIYDDVDGFAKPITEFYIYFQFKPSSTETMFKKTYDANSTETVFSKVAMTPVSYNLGDIISGDLVTYDKNNFLEENLNLQEFYIQAGYESSTKFLMFKYRPFIEVKIRQFGSENITQNISATTVENTIPSYAVKLDDDGNYLWRDLLDFGYVDPIDNIGLTFPFVNGTHYVHGNYVLSMSPDMTHSNTASVYSEILFKQNQLINSVPVVPLNNSGEIC